MPCADLVEMPMHASRLPIVNLHAIEADVPRSLAWILGKDGGQRNEWAAIGRPAGQHGQNVQVGLTMNDLLTFAVFHQLRRDPCEANQLQNNVQFLFERFWRFGLDELFHLARDLLDVLYSQRQSHSFARTEGVDQNWDLLADNVL